MKTVINHSTPDSWILLQNPPIAQLVLRGHLSGLVTCSLVFWELLTPTQTYNWKTTALRSSATENSIYLQLIPTSGNRLLQRQTEDAPCRGDTGQCNKQMLRSVILKYSGPLRPLSGSIRTSPLISMPDIREIKHFNL